MSHRHVMAAGASLTTIPSECAWTLGAGSKDGGRVPEPIAAHGVTVRPVALRPIRVSDHARIGSPLAL